MSLTDNDLNHIFKKTEPLWQSLKNKKIFVTGGTGFLGVRLLESFIYADKQLKLNCQMLVLSRNPDAFKIKCPHLADVKAIRFQQGDVRNFVFPEGSFDFIIHAATDASAQLNEQNPLLMIDTIVEGTRQALDFAIHCKAKRFLLTSSGAVYGKQPFNLSHITEDYVGAPDPTQPTSAYEEGKRLAELLCGIYQKQFGIEIIIARCFAFVGPYLNLNIHYAVGNFIRDGLEGKTIQVLGDGTPYRSYLYTADLAIWLWTILFQGRPGRAYNVGSDREITILDLAKRISDCFPHHPKVKVAKISVPGQEPTRYVPSVNLAKKELGLQIWIDIEEALKRTIRFYQNI